LHDSGPSLDKVLLMALLIKFPVRVTTVSLMYVAQSWWNSTLSIDS